MTDWTVEMVGPSHAAVVAGLHAATIGGRWSAESVARLLALPGAVALLALAAEPDAEGAWDAGAPAGFALVLPSGDAAELAAIGVLPAARRTGCARALMRALMRHIAVAGFDKCLLEVAEDNAAARTLYTSCGFSEYGRRPDYYRRRIGPDADAILFAWDTRDHSPIF